MEDMFITAGTAVINTHTHNKHARCLMGKPVHTCLSSSYLIVHVLHCPPPPPAHSFIIGPAVIIPHNPEEFWVRFPNETRHPSPSSHANIFVICTAVINAYTVVTQDRRHGGPSRTFFLKKVFLKKSLNFDSGLNNRGGFIIGPSHWPRHGTVVINNTSQLLPGPL